MGLVCIGECMVELRQAGEGLYARSFAGDAYNTAVYLKRSAPGIDVAMLSATGVGGLSETMRQAWAAEGVDDGLTYRIEGAEPGLYMIELTAAGERSFRYWRSVSPARQWLRLLLADGGANRLAGADLVYLSGISLAILSDDERLQALELLRTLKGRVGAIAFDPNIRPALWRDLATARAAIEPVIGLADILRTSREDGELMFGLADATAQIDAYRSLGAREIALTLDADGCIWADGDNATSLAAHRVEAVRDTSGAGDSFNGAYLAARLSGQSGLAAAQAGLDVAARVVSHPGAIVPRSVSHPAKGS